MGGTQAAELCNRDLHRVFAGELRRVMKEQRHANSAITDEAVAEAFMHTFQHVDDQLEKAGAFNWGCTATVVLARRSRSGLRLHVANVGDSRALAIDNARGY